jgi:hypothetical protein
MEQKTKCFHFIRNVDQIMHSIIKKTRRHAPAGKTIKTCVLSKKYSYILIIQLIARCRNQEFWS